MDKLKNKMEAVQRNWVANDPSEKRVVESLSNKSSPPSQALLDSLVIDTFDTRSLMHINRHVFSTLDLPPQNYRAIFKALTVIEHLCLYGSDRFVSEALESIQQVQKLLSMRYSEGGVDKGAAVRNKAQEVEYFLSSKAVIQEKRKCARQKNVPSGQSKMSMAAFQQKHKEAATESGGEKDNNTRKSTTPKARSRSNTAEVHEHSLTGSDHSGFSGDPPQDLFSAGFGNSQYEPGPNLTASASPGLYNPSPSSMDSYQPQSVAPQFQNQTALRPAATDAYTVPIQRQEYQQYPPRVQSMPHMYQQQQPHCPQNNLQYQQQQPPPPLQMAYPPQQHLPQQGVGMAIITPQQYCQPEQVTYQQPVDQNHYIGQPPPPLQQWNQTQPPVNGGTCYAPVPPLQQQQQQQLNHQQGAAYEQPGACRAPPPGGLYEAQANNGTQFTNLPLHHTEAQQPTQNLVHEGQETYVNSPASWPQGNVINEVAVGHQNQEQQQRQLIPTFAAQAGAMEQLRGAINRLKPVGMGVPRLRDDSQPSVFEGRGVAVEKQLDQKHVDARRANLTDDGEEIVVGTTIESSEFQNMHQKLRNTNLQ